MNNKLQYRKWVGVVLGFLLHGSAHFLSGKRADGLKWYFAILACSILPIFIIAIPGGLTYAIGLVVWFLSIVLWLIMLKQSYRPVPCIGFFGWVALFAISFALNYAWTKTIYSAVRPFRAVSGSMAPTIQPGDHLAVERISGVFGKPERGDIVVFKTDGIASLSTNTFFIMRIAGVPGDRIRIEPPNLIVNNQAVTYPPVFSRIASAVPPFDGFRLAFKDMFVGALLTHPTDTFVLEEDAFFVLGDNTENSYDSRYWGAVPEKNIIGRATRIYWPFSRIVQSLGNE